MQKTAHKRPRGTALLTPRPPANVSRETLQTASAKSDFMQTGMPELCKPECANYANLKQETKPMTTKAKKATKKRAKKATAKATAKRVSLAQQTRDNVQSATGTRATAKTKEALHPCDPKRAPYTNALHSDTARAHMESNKKLTAQTIADAIKRTIQDYDFKNDGYTAEAMQTTLDFIRANVNTATGKTVQIDGILSRNNKAGDLSALAYWGLWSARQYRNSADKSNNACEMQFTVTAQGTNAQGINHTGEKTRAKIRAFNLK